MNGHEVTEPAGEDARLVVSVTSECFAHSVTSAGGWPGLVIDYGGAQLVLEEADPRVAEVFALGLARAALEFASRCRYRSGGDHG